jgi:hypothetical protein
VDQKSSKKDLDYSNGAAPSVLSGVDVVDSMAGHLIRPSSMLPGVTAAYMHHIAAQYMFQPQVAAYHQMYSHAMGKSTYYYFLFCSKLLILLLF